MTAAGPSLELGVADGHGRPGALLRTPFDGDFIETLKRRLPARDRWFDDARRAWWVAAEHEPAVRTLLLARWGGFLLLGGVTGVPDQYIDRGGSAVQERLL